MADLGISIVGKLIEILGSPAIQEVFDMWDYNSQLDELKKTVKTIEKVLLDADAKRELSHEEQDYINNLKDVVYDADDLFDEIRTLAELKQLKSLNKVDKIIAKVRSIFSSKNPVVQTYKRTHEVKDIKSRLVSIADNHTKFGFSVDYKPIVRRREETCSYVNVKDIIGREEDKETIIDMLLDPSGKDDVCFLSIVGVGGLGKTTLAQIIVNDEKIKKEFDSSFSLWVCVSDQEGVDFDLKSILCKILELVNKKPDVNSSKELVQKQFQEQFGGKKYLLVLDDVWNEDRKLLLEFRNLLESGAGGTKIVITTRSEKTARNIGSEHVHKLKALSKEDSRCLFEMSAFEEGEKNNELVEIGEKIVEKCHRTPLAIKVVGSLLYGQDISKWKSIQKSGLGEIYEGSDKILPILKLSYHNLTPSLKSCFSYCAIFRKGSRIDKDSLIYLWMAQGYIVPLDGGQSVEDAAEEYFLILMRRCFFQDIDNDRYGNVVSLKIHDLMHDVAQEVGKEEISVVTSRESKLGENVRHVSIGIENILLCSSKIRSCICWGVAKHLWDKQVGNLTVLRVFDLSNLQVKSLPQTIDRLLLLRYLNLGSNYSLEVLPDEITRLYNLQTLVLRYCRNLKEIPKDFGNLINLRHLDFYGCDKLSGMPLGMNKLTNLTMLPYFVTSDEISDDELKVLRQILTKLKGKLCVVNTNKGIDRHTLYRERLNLSEKVTINCRWEGERVILGGGLETLELPSYLKELELSRYNGTTLPWTTLSSLQHLLHIQIEYCRNLNQIPVLSKLLNLKSLELGCLDNMEYMENNGMSSSSSNDTKEVTGFFPSLESLEIKHLPKLKGWWKGDFPGMRLRFPRLSHLEIILCPNLTSFGPCSNPEYLPELQLPNLCRLKISECPKLASNLICSPTLEKLELRGTSERMLITGGELVKLREMVIEKVDHLKLLPPTNCLSFLEIRGDIDVESALVHAQRCVSSLQTLKFIDCENLRRLPRLSHFTTLEELHLSFNYQLIICEDEEEEHWKCLPQSLRRLEFSFLRKMKSLPKGLQHLTSLQLLSLYSCRNMEGGLPEWMSSLSSLQFLNIVDCPGINSLPEAIKDLNSLKKLSIEGCSDLEERCKKPDGVDFSKIQHIPNINIFPRKR